jgi:hypothetical protein
MDCEMVNFFHKGLYFPQEVGKKFSLWETIQADEDHRAGRQWASNAADQNFAAVLRGAVGAAARLVEGKSNEIIPAANAKPADAHRQPRKPAS